ncbi:dihydromonapterin reductase [Phytohalomonas tamaricis]|uniref:dihydromonapterin reductase n=1 Tax=Phytohalomonas tamaricis TaxID=2081032 RepID=UPI000D0BAA7A|nr:dihydromonapterin reductase [Phytohalomonas tamaricis]
MSQAPILITGGAQRLGRYCAERLHDDGHPVIITYRREREAVEALRKQGIQAIQADFSTDTGIAAFIDHLGEATPRLRAIIHNASQWRADIDNDETGQAFEALFRIHMQAPYMINMRCRELLEACQEPMRDIIHITDYAAQKGSRNHVAYAATKAGLDNLTRSFAALYGPSIKVNAIAPASIMLNEDDDDAYADYLRDKSIMATTPGPAVIWQSVRYLLDNPFVTGVTLPVDGGRHVK